MHNYCICDPWFFTTSAPFSNLHWPNLHLKNPKHRDFLSLNFSHTSSSSKQIFTCCGVKQGVNVCILLDFHQRGRPRDRLFKTRSIFSIFISFPQFLFHGHDDDDVRMMHDAEADDNVCSQSGSLLIMDLALVKKGQGLVLSICVLLSLFLIAIHTCTYDTYTCENTCIHR